MKKLLIALIILATLAGGGYFGLKQYAPEILEEYLPSSTPEMVDSSARTTPAKHINIAKRQLGTIETAKEFCVRQKGSVRKHGGGDTPVIDVCFINDGKDGVLCDLQLFFERKCGLSAIDENAISTQQAFIESRGIPGAYMVFFSDSKFDEDKKPVARDFISRIESWTFGSPTNKISHFGKGFFVEEEDLDEAIELMDHNISPLWFREGTKANDVIALLGKADCEITEEAGPHTIRTLKYEETDTKPVISVSFSEDQIIAATAGIAFKSGDSSDTLCP